MLAKTSSHLEMRNILLSRWLGKKLTIESHYSDRIESKSRETEVKEKPIELEVE